MFTESPNSSQKLADPYVLLRSYSKKARINSKAYALSETYFRSMYKKLTYPLVVLSAVASVLSGFDLHPVSNWIVMSISLTTLILLGFNQAINPKDKEHAANQVKTEFGEIASNIRQFIQSNSKTHTEIRAYSEVIHEQMNIWNALSPPIKDSFIDKATKSYEIMHNRIRKHTPPARLDITPEKKEFIETFLPTPTVYPNTPRPQTED